MRFLLLALLVSMPVMAQDLDSSRELKDLQYIPKAMTFYGETALSQQSYEATTEGDPDTETRIEQFYAHQKVGFGLTDTLSLAVQYDHMLHGSTDTENGGAQQPIEDQSGPTNPTLSATMRLAEQANTGWNLDGVVAFSPDLITSEVHSNKRESDAAEGGAAYSVGARLGRKTKNYHSMYEAYLDYFGETSIKDKDAGTKSKDDAYMGLRLRGNWQANLLPFLDIRGVVGLDHDMKQVNKDGGTKTTTDPTTKFVFGPTALITVIPDQLLLTFAWNVNYYLRYDVKSGGTSNEVQDFRGFDLKAAALYQF